MPYTFSADESEMIERSLDLQALLDSSEDGMTIEEQQDLEAFCHGE